MNGTSGRSEEHLEEPPLSAEKVHPDDVDALLAKELNSMTFKERELVYEEIHGVDERTKEKPEFVNERLEALETELQKISKKMAYDQAEQISKGYVNERSFRLMFLRSKYFDARKAAVSLVHFMEEKLKYFGLGALARPLYLNDLDRDDLALLKSGSNQFLPARDRAGRAIFGDFYLISNFTFQRPENVVKIFIYMVMAAVEEEETQKRGMVGLFYFVGATSFMFDRKFVQVNNLLSGLLNCLPCKLTAMHICFNDPRLRMIKALIMLTMGRDRRVRLRVHIGTHMECQYSLMTFGMPVPFIPVTDAGDVKATNHMKWIAKRKIKESFLKRAQPFEGINLPSNNDVLVGRGKPIGDHAGNTYLRELVNLHLEEYERGSKQEKTAIAVKVVQLAKKYPCRFLKRNPDGWWAEVTDEVARGKVSTSFRSARTTKMVESKGPDFVDLQNSKRIRLHQDRGLTCFSGPCWEGN